MPSKGQQALGQSRRLENHPLGAIVPGYLLRGCRRDHIKTELQCLQQVVEIVGHTTRKLPQRLQTLRLR